MKTIENHSKPAMVVLAVLALVSLGTRPLLHSRIPLGGPHRRIKNVKTNGRSQCVEIGRIQRSREKTIYNYIYTYIIHTYVCMYIYIYPKSPKAVLFESLGKVPQKGETIAMPRFYGRGFTAMLLDSTAEGL